MLRFFLKPQSKSYLRNLEFEFGGSTNAIRLELNRFEEAGLLISSMEKNKKMFQANEKHPLYTEIRSIVRKSVGLDQLVEKVVDKLGNVTRAYLSGDLARGLDTRVIDFVLIGDEIDQEYLKTLISKVSSLITRNIQCFVLTSQEEQLYINAFPDPLLVYEKPETGKEKD